MSKIEEALQKQMKNEEYAQDAADCMTIYKKLLEMYDGKLWRSIWNILVSIRVKRERELVMLYHPTLVGKVFLHGLRDYEKIDVYMVFGGSAAGYAEYRDADEFNAQKSRMCYNLEHLTFNTQDEKNAYFKGLEDGQGWEGYTSVPEDFYKLIDD